MSKAEEFAYSKYPKDKKGVLYDLARNSIIQGYRQAEKDLELTWEDMMIIHRCIKDAMNYHLYKMMEGVEGQKVVYQEVLKRFKERKEK